MAGPGAWGRQAVSHEHHLCPGPRDALAATRGGSALGRRRTPAGRLDWRLKWWGKDLLRVRKEDGRALYAAAGAAASDSGLRAGRQGFNFLWATAGRA
jgi:hypothetical protein